jgi:hypothetical protein
VGDSATITGVFSQDYATARRRFRAAAERLGWTLEAHPIGMTGPDGGELTVDVGISPHTDTERVLVLSSGVHGVEGFFGSAVEVGLLEDWARGDATAPSCKCVFLHGLNPYGFAWLRRFDEKNIDPNRNFLLPGEKYEGSPKGYAALDGLLNPRRPPSGWEPFTLKALWTVLRYGMPALRQAVAGGQYDFPQGLFYGGAGPSRMQLLLGEHLGRWLSGSRVVAHLDFHTGLGPHGSCKLLLDYVPSERQLDWLNEWFGAGSFEACDGSSIAYEARGGLGRWCVSREPGVEYLFACAEFGTYGPIQVLTGLRFENQAHHYGRPDADSTRRAKERLKELFCPSAESWRSQVLTSGRDLVGCALRGLAGVSLR